MLCLFLAHLHYFLSDLNIFSVSLKYGQRCQTSCPTNYFVISPFSGPNLSFESVAFNPDLLFKGGNWALGSFDKQLCGTCILDSRSHLWIECKAEDHLYLQCLHP